MNAKIDTLMLRVLAVLDGSPLCERDWTSIVRMAGAADKGIFSDGDTADSAARLKKYGFVHDRQGTVSITASGRDITDVVPEAEMNHLKRLLRELLPLIASGHAPDAERALRAGVEARIPPNVSPSIYRLLETKL